ncbi:SAM-dependent methyltransferase [Mesorhizobium amorphae]|uniref:SAM-dependent methyltransferase n=1 Tax=Mesorhizobium amorphae TaxID=71433 RepID=UPI003D67D6CA
MWEGKSLTRNHHQLFRLELAENDPRQFDGSPFERQRHAELLRLALCGGAVTHGLEVGGATGAFTDKLAPHCRRLTVVDVGPQAPSRTRLSMQDSSHIDWVVCDVQRYLSEELFDLIVVGDLLCRLAGIAELETAIENLVGMLAPDGHLVFGSARDSIYRHGGYAYGAETPIAMLNEKLCPLLRVRCQGNAASEDWLLALFKNPGQTAHSPANRKRD